ncbi:MAG: hypothetical protein JWR45_3190, partial [Blastococcus sp.]|nr:hypothetical protein [Blastococcus sp.]
MRWHDRTVMPFAGPDGHEAATVGPPYTGMMTIGDVLARVGPGLLRPLTTSAALLARRVTGVCIRDGATTDALPGELLLAVGVEPVQEAVAGVGEQAAALDLPGV